MTSTDRIKYLLTKAEQLESAPDLDIKFVAHKVSNLRLIACTEAILALIERLDRLHLDDGK